MKQNNEKNSVPIICCIVGLILALFGLIMGVGSINAAGFGGIGVIFIIPSIIAIIVIVLDLLKLLNGKGLIFSVFSCIIKIAIIIIFIPSTIYDIKQELEFGISNLDFDLFLIISLIIITIPSVMNIINYIKTTKNSKNNKNS